MKATILTLVALSYFTHLSAQTKYYFDWNFKKTERPIKAQYYVYDQGADNPSIVLNYTNNKKFAAGVLHIADTLSFDGEVVFYNDKEDIKYIQFCKQGRIMPSIPITKDLKKTTKTTPYFMNVNDKGRFYAYMSQSSDIENSILIADGQVTYSDSLALNGIITYYDNKGYMKLVKQYKDGKELPFIQTTLDIKEPYEIISVMTHHGRNFKDISEEMQFFLSKCKGTGADGVIGIQSSLTQDEFGQSVLIQGTLIRKL